MSTGRRPSRVAWISGAGLALLALVVGVTVIVAHAGAQQAAANPAAAIVATLTTPAANPVTPAVPPVPALRNLTPPDIVVTLRQATDASAVEHFRALPGVRSVALADRGSIRLGRIRLRVLGVPLATIRGFTPSLTASSTALWRSVARGEVTVSYADSRRLTHRLGDTLVAHGGHGQVGPLRIGAFATIGLPGGQALVSRPAAQALGLARDREVLIAAPKVSLDTLRTDVRIVFGAKAHVAVTRAAHVDQALSSSYARATIPATYLALYRRAAPTCLGLPWTVLAGIGTVETGNGRDVHRSIAGAEGPMQFLPSTWATWGYDADGDGKADIDDPVDAVFSAARYLCAAGAGRGGQSLDDAIFAYNHAWWYVREVIVIANSYA
jgi:Transglycosylase SLT domain